MMIRCVKCESVRRATSKLALLTEFSCTNNRDINDLGQKTRKNKQINKNNTTTNQCKPGKGMKLGKLYAQSTKRATSHEHTLVGINMI